MGVWYIALLSVIIGVVANEHAPSNPPYLLEEVKATAESRVLERVEHLLQTLSAKIEVLDDGIGEMKPDISRLFVAQNETNEMIITANKSLENVKEQLRNFSTSTRQRMINHEHKLERLPEVIGDIGRLFLALHETNEMIQTANKSFTQRMINLQHRIERLPEDTGVYVMHPGPSENIKFEVSRDWTNNHGFGSNWIIFQRRFDGSVDFYRNWTEYKQGFGYLPGEHWLGLDKLHSIVKTRRHELLIVLEDFDGVIAYAHYDDFKIGNESEKYVLKSVGNYTGTAGDSFTNHKDELFSTYDQDNDKIAESCSKSYKGAWWFYTCFNSHLNGQYYIRNSGTNDALGIIWYKFQGLDHSLKSTKMMVRPVA